MRILNSSAVPLSSTKLCYKKIRKKKQQTVVAWPDEPDVRVSEQNLAVLKMTTRQEERLLLLYGGVCGCGVVARRGEIGCEWLHRNKFHPGFQDVKATRAAFYYILSSPQDFHGKKLGRCRVT